MTHLFCSGRQLCELRQHQTRLHDLSEAFRPSLCHVFEALLYNGKSEQRHFMIERYSNHFYRIVSSREDCLELIVSRAHLCAIYELEKIEWRMKISKCRMKRVWIVQTRAFYSPLLHLQLNSLHHSATCHHVSICTRTLPVACCHILAPGKASKLWYQGFPGTDIVH